MKYQANQGYIIPAFNNEHTNYVDCAVTLAKSLKHWHPDAKVCLLTDKEYSHPVFDFVELLPYESSNKEWKLDNDWQVFAASPFHETIKLEADMLVTSPVDHWWTLFRNHDVWVSTGARSFKDQKATSRKYRQVFDSNNLPDVYNAVTYWRQSQLAKQFFDTVHTLFSNWNDAKKVLLFADNEQPTTDLIYAMAIDLLGREKFINSYGPSITHMKPAINDLSSDNWENELVWEIVDGQVRINGYTQYGFFHYHNKHLASKFGEYYECN